MMARAVPAGFVELRSHKQTWWVKAGWEEIIPAGLGFSQSAIGNRQSAIPGGRGAIQQLALNERETTIIRHYYRGGLIRHFMRDLYWARPPRPFTELICTETARQRGVPTVEVLGAGVAWITIGLYRGRLITRAAAGFLNLWEWLRAKPPDEERQKIIPLVAQTIARMHMVGIAHADLNLTNILVRVTTDQPAVLLIDFDRARVGSGPLPRRWRERNLRRLRRSLDKLDPGGLLTFPADLEIFCRAYQQYSAR